MAALSAQLLSTRPSLAVSRKSVSGEGRGRQGGACACGRGLVTSLPDGCLMRLGRCLARWCWRLDLITSAKGFVLHHDHGSGLSCSAARASRAQTVCRAAKPVAARLVASSSLANTNSVVQQLGA